MEGRIQWHRRLLGDLLTWAAVKQTERLPQKERSRYLGVLAVTFVPEALARAKDPGRGRWGPGMGSTVPPNQAGWPCATRCWKVQLVPNLDLDLGQNGAKVGVRLKTLNQTEDKTIKYEWDWDWKRRQADNFVFYAKMCVCWVHAEMFVFRLIWHLQIQKLLKIQHSEMNRENATDIEE